MTDTPKRFSEPRDSSEGNTRKFNSYAEAFARIAKAQEAGFYLEAVTLSESIISDRLVSYTSRPGTGKQPNLNQAFALLIKEIRDVAPELYGELDQWKNARNTLIHQFAKSLPGTPTTAVEDQLAIAKQAAAEGERLARRVCDWHREQKRKEPEA